MAVLGGHDERRGAVRPRAYHARHLAAATVVEEHLFGEKGTLAQGFTGRDASYQLKSILSLSSISRRYTLPSGNTIRIRKKISTESLWNIADLNKYSTVPFIKNN